MKVHKQVARQDIYQYGARVADPSTKSGTRLNRSQPRDDEDKVIVPKGSTYYWWKFRYGGKRISLTYPDRRQLTQNEYQLSLYDLDDQLNALQELNHSSDFETGIQELVDAIQELADYQREKRDNMPESLQDGDIGQLLEDRAEELEGYITELEWIDLTELQDAEEALDGAEHGDERASDEVIAELEQAVEEALDRVRSDLGSIGIG